MDVDDARRRENLKQKEIVSMVNTLVLGNGEVSPVAGSLHSELERVGDATIVIAVNDREQCAPVCALWLSLGLT